jgi:hypothetical protein
MTCFGITGRRLGKHEGIELFFRGDGSKDLGAAWEPVSLDDGPFPRSKWVRRGTCSPSRLGNREKH